jgi:aminopeptidase YwaD
LVLVAAQPGAVQQIAIGIHGAAGIVSYAQNQRSAWYGEDENLIRWGHLESFYPANEKTFAFMISLKTARALRERLAHGESIRMHATVKAGQHPGVLSIVTATIPGADPKLRDEEIAFSCHLDHQRPGANDNASGCVTILEVARTLQKLIANGTLPRPARTLRFIWPPEIEGTTTLLNAKPEFAQRIKAVVHMDMVGGNAAITKSIFHVTRGPMSLPSFVYDVGAAFGEFVNQESALYAGTGEAEFPFVAPEGGKEALQAEFADYSMGSDHDVYEEGAFRIPAIYMNDYPDRYIHTDGDVAANIDPTKLKRAAFIGAASGYFLAQMSTRDTAAVAEIVERASLLRTAKALARRAGLHKFDADLQSYAEVTYEDEVTNSISKFAQIDPLVITTLDSFIPARSMALFGEDLKTLTKQPLTRYDLIRYERTGSAKGPMAVFGYDYLTGHFGDEQAAKLVLLKFQGLRGSGPEYAYEALNFVDGAKTVGAIASMLSAEYGPVPVAAVAEYLHALESIGVIQQVK